MADTLIEFKQAVLGYNGKAVLPVLNLQIYRGDFWGIIGPNGSGKSTMLKAVLGLISPMSGEIATTNAKFGYIMQRKFLDEIFPLSVEEVVLMGRYGLIGPFKRPREIDYQAVKESLETMGIGNLAACPYGRLSGGQKQRVLMARALTCEPEVLILDEPTNDLDIKGTIEIMELIKTLHESKGITVILVSHALTEVLNYVHKITFLNHQDVKIYPVESLVGSGILANLFNVKIQVQLSKEQNYMIERQKDANIS